MTREELEDWAETHHVIVEAIVEAGEESNVINITREIQGMGGVWLLGIELTDKFEALHKDTVWGEDVDWLDTIHEFINEELYGDNI